MQNKNNLQSFENSLKNLLEDPLDQFCFKVCSTIAEIVPMARSIIYLRNDQDQMAFSSGFAVDTNTHGKKIFNKNEGYVGQVAASSKELFLNLEGNSSLYMETGIGKIAIKAILYIPLIYGNQVFGVYEALFIKSVQEEEIELLRSLCVSFSVLLQYKMNTEETRRLLELSKEQSFTLLRQQEELQQNLEEVRATQEQLNQQIVETNRIKSELAARVSLLNKTALVSETDLYGTILYANEKFCEVSGYSIYELVGRPHNIIRHPDTPSEIFKEMWATIKEGNIFRGKIKNRKKNGDFYWVEASVSPIKNEKGQIVKYLAIRFDITDKVIAEEQLTNLLKETNKQNIQLSISEEELKQSMEELQALHEDISAQINEKDHINQELSARMSFLNKIALVSESDLYGTLLYANEKFCEVSGYTKAELIGKPHNLIRHPDMPKSLFKELWSTLKSGNMFNGIIKNRKKDGSYYWVDAYIIPVLDKAGKPYKYLAIRLDITEQIEATTGNNHYLEKLKNSLEKLVSAKNIEN